MMIRAALLPGAPFLLIGLVLAGFAITLAIPAAEAALYGQRAKGTVIELKQPPVKGQHQVVIQYAAEGKIWRVQSQQRYSPDEQPVGSTMPVLYRTGQAGVARVATFEDLWGRPIFTAFFAVMLSAVGLSALCDQTPSTAAGQLTYQMQVVALMARPDQAARAHE